MLQASVIIPNLHSPHLGDVLAALRRQTTSPLEAIVVGQDRFGHARDDGLVRVLATPRPAAPAIARNAGIALARGDVCCFLDSDCVPAPGWLERLLARVAEGRPVVAGGVAVGGETYWQRCDNIAAMGPLLATAPAGERPYLITANAAIRRDVLRQVGWFDEGFRFAAGEDTDFSYRLRRAGIPIFFEPRAQVAHRTSRATPGAVWRHIWRYGHEWPPVQARYPDMAGGVSPWQRLLGISRALALLLVPPLTLRDTLAIYAQQPELARRHWLTVPAVFWARLAWYAGRMAYEGGRDA